MPPNMLRLSLLITSCLASAAACAHRRGAPASAPSWSPSDSAVYITVLDSLVPADASGRIPIAVELLPVAQRYDTPAALAWLRRELPTVSGAMFETLRVVASSDGDVRARLKRVPGSSWIDSATLVSRDNMSVIRLGVRLSRVAYSADSAQALVYVVKECGAVCGSADYVLLSRDESRTWRIVRVLRRWTG
jgi:hypothetical protein